MDTCYQKSKAFTLIELLVVIAIIALLLSVLLPSLNKAKQQALTTICMAQQRQASLANISYGSENDSYNVPSWSSTWQTTGQQWFTYLRSYIGDSEGAYECPKAKNIDMTLAHPGGYYGSAKSAWNVGTDVHTLAAENTRGGFGYNNWLETKGVLGNGEGIPKQTSVKDPYVVPTFGDCTWPDAGWVEETDTIPLKEEREAPELSSRPGWIRRFSMNRHREGINLAFLDGHGEKAVNVDDLLTFKWHKKWDLSLVKTETKTE